MKYAILENQEICGADTEHGRETLPGAEWRTEEEMTALLGEWWLVRAIVQGRYTRLVSHHGVAL